MSVGPESVDTRAGLEEERAYFLRSLDDLEAERSAGDIDEADYTVLRDDYTVRAADVLRRIDALDRPVDGEPPGSEPRPVTGDAEHDRPSAERGRAVPAADAPPGRRRRRRMLTGVAVLLIVGGIAWGGVGVAGLFSGGSSSSPETLLVDAQNATASGDADSAMADYQKVLDHQPDNVEALTGQGAILVETGAAAHDSNLLRGGVLELEKAEIIDPTYGPAYGYRGLGYFDLGQYPAAVAQLQTYLQDTPAPARVAAITALLARAEAQVK